MEGMSLEVSLGNGKPLEFSGVCTKVRFVFLGKDDSVQGGECIRECQAGCRKL